MECSIVLCDKILYSAQFWYQTDTTWYLAVISAKDYASGTEIFWLVRNLDRRAYAAVRVKKEGRR